MARKRAVTTQVGRDAKTGRFIPIKEAKRRKSTAVVETIKRSGKAKYAASRRGGLS